MPLHSQYKAPSYCLLPSHLPLQNGIVRYHDTILGLGKLTLRRLQFMSAGLARCAVPTSIHCDHLIQASTGADADLKVHAYLF